jgi:ribosomal protein S1
VEFITEHPIGSRVDGEVVAFTSHGAHVVVGDVRCYVALRGLGDPPPRGAREVLSRGETRTFVVEALDAPRRGIDLALPGYEQLRAPPELPESLPEVEATPRRRPAKRRTSTRPVPADKTVGARGAVRMTPLAADQASADVEATLPESEANLPPKKTTTRKKAAPSKKKATAKKSTAKKSTTARKSPAKRTTAKKSTAKKSTARKTTAKKKATAKKSTARKSPAKKKKATGTARKRS